MLVTTCPECGTTFRVSVGVLEKADGQVRCGRCATIFDANVRLRQLEAETPRAGRESATEPESEPGVADPIAPAAESEPALLPEPESESESEAEVEARPESDPEAASQAEPVVASPVAVTAAPPLAAAAADTRVTEPDQTEAPTADAADWQPHIDRNASRQHWGWTAGAMLLLISLLGQLTHQFRHELVRVPLVGSALAGAYDRLGGGAPSSMDMDQYDLLDLTAVAEPTTEDQGWLIIETSVHNKGPNIQPYPHIFVRLLDRWEDTIAGRYFAPAEYAVSAIDDTSRMTAGTTIDAQFIIMDPGPSATGFELELCVGIDDGYLCESDFPASR